MIDTEDPEVMADGYDEYAEDSEDEQSADDLFQDFYVETSSGCIHEVQMFDGYCLVRPASPTMYAGIRKLTHVEFSKEFHEYGGDHEAVRNFLRNAVAEFIVE